MILQYDNLVIFQCISHRMVPFVRMVTHYHYVHRASNIYGFNNNILIAIYLFQFAHLCDSTVVQIVKRL